MQAELGKYLTSNRFHVTAHIIVLIASAVVALGGQFGINMTSADAKTIASVVSLFTTGSLTLHLNESN